MTKKNYLTQFNSQKGTRKAVSVKCTLPSASGRLGCVELTFTTKTDDDTERQLVHTLTHAIVFIVSICLCRTSGAQYICPLSSRTAQRTIAGPAQAVTVV